MRPPMQVPVMIAAPFAQLRVPFDPRLLHRFARSDHRELREAVHKSHVLVGEIILGNIAAHEGGVPEADRAEFWLLKLPDSRSSLDKRGPELVPVESQRGDDANSGNGDARHLGSDPASGADGVASKNQAR